MKTFLIIFTLLSLASCSGTKQTVVGTIISINQTTGKACDFGTITIQPAATQMAGNLITINLDDFDDAKAAQVNEYLNKKVTIKYESTTSFCSKSTLQITSLN